MIVSKTDVSSPVVTAWSWAIFTTESVALYTGGLALYAACSTALVAAAVLQTGPVAALLSMAWLRWVGRISYGAYLYHWPIYLWMSPERTSLEGGSLVATRIVVSLALSDLSYRWFERPVRNGRVFRGSFRWLAPLISVVASESKM